MAILEAIPGLDVSVCIDGEPLEEYDDDEEEEVKPGRVGQWQAARTVCKYITSESDKQFCIRITVGRSYNMDSSGLGFPIRIDGKLMTTPCMTKPNNPRVRNSLLQDYVRNVYGASGRAERGDQAILKRFKFSKIETTTDDGKLADVKKDSKVFEEVGEIKVLVYRESDSAPSTGSTMTEAQRSTEVHEKALKGQAKSHSTSLGPTEVTTVNFVTSERLDGDDFPIAIFKFKYRSKEALKQLLIIERTPEPEPQRVSAPPAALNLENLNAQQKAELERFLKGLVGNNGTGSPERRVKRERENGEGSGAAPKKRRSGEKITIDLTEDSDEENTVPL